MINKEKIKIYKDFEGDIDFWILMGSKKDKLRITESEWRLIDNLLQDITLVKNGLTSKEFSENLNIKLNENCENLEVINNLRKLADKQ